VALDAETFKIQYPEFAQADDAVVEAAIDYATLRTPASVWGDNQNAGIGLRAAKKLALSPFARNMGLVAKDGSTVYDEELDELVQVVAVGGLVI